MLPRVCGAGSTNGDGRGYVPYSPRGRASERGRSTFNRTAGVIYQFRTTNLGPFGNGSREIEGRRERQKAQAVLRSEKCGALPPGYFNWS